MRNVSTHTIGYLQPEPHIPGVTAPEAQVLNAAGHLVSPPALPYFPALPGPAPFIATLRPGGNVTQRVYVVLAGARVRAAVQFLPVPTTDLSRGLVTLTTRPLSLHLTPADPPAVSLHTGTAGPVVDVTQPPGVRGRPRLLSYADCGFPQYASTEWAPSGLRLRLGCTPLQSWHLRVGWPGHSVAAIDYPAAQRGPAPVPVPSPTLAPAVTATPSVGTAEFTRILHRANLAMASVHSLHADGLHQALDSSARTDLSIRADCTSGRDAGLPVVLRSLQGGSYSQAGRTETIGRDYLIAGPLIPQPDRATSTWKRSPPGSGPWRRADLRRAWSLDRFLPDDIMPNLAYINQSCPEPVRQTYLQGLALPFGNTPHVVSRTTVHGHQVWQLREAVWFAIDLFVDVHTYRLVRLRLWAGNGTNGWQVRFDYSRYNLVPPTRLPRSIL